MAELESRSYWAFLVGINSYREVNQFPSLNFCVNDVKSMEQTLATVGYTVVSLRDDLPYGSARFPSRNNIEAEFKSLCENVGPDDVLLVYFACHGTRQVDGKPRLIAWDTRSNMLERTAIAISDLEQWMRDSPAERLILLLDACHIGVGTDQRGLADPEFIHDVYEATTGFALIAASTDQQPAKEQKGHGIFSRYLLSGLQGEAALSAADPNQKFVTVGSLQRYVLHHLKQWTVKQGYTQKPQARADGDLGDMLLVDYRIQAFPAIDDVSSSIMELKSTNRGQLVQIPDEPVTLPSPTIIRLRAKRQTYNTLVKKYDALEQQISHTRDADDQIDLQAKQDAILTQMEEIYQEIETLVSK